MSGRREKVDDLLAAAVARPAAEREGFLREACAGDTGLLHEVQHLVTLYDQAAFIEESPIAVLSSADIHEGTQIGRYTILEQVGEGACGVVYLAEQREPIRRRVALKIIKLGMDTRHVLARFEAEWKTLALLDHPNVARVFDCGTTDAGRPYFIMEWVQGVPLLRYCDEKRLGVRARMELFAAISRAIQHAHERGVIHRDIKPSNIIVAQYAGVASPKVIDFGIAKATEARPGDSTLFTGLAQMIGTPAYMSPEQADMGPTDARSDVYSLGAVLYALLTGTTPFGNKDLAAGGLQQLRQRIRGEAAQRPSQRVEDLPAHQRLEAAQARATDPAHLRAQLRGDIDWICLRCLEKEPARRYATAVALAEDVEAYLANRPVDAGRPGVGPVVQRLARRYRVPAVVVGLAAVVGAAAAFWYVRSRAPAAVNVSAAGEVASVAVLPFAPATSDPGDRYLADGVHEDLINDLAKIHQLRVMARSAVLPYRDHPARPRKVAEDLQVEDVIEGTVTRENGHARVTARLIDARVEQPIWEQTFDADASDVFGVEAQLAASIARALRTPLTPQEARLIARRPTEDRLAYDLFLQARSREAAIGDGSLADHLAILKLYQQAVQRDPNFVQAYDRMVLLDLKMYRYSWLDATPQRLEQAKAAAEQAVQLAPDDPETKLVLAKLAYNGWNDYPGALKEFQAALADLPNDEQALFGMSLTLRRLGRWDESTDYARLAYERDPAWLSCAIVIAENLSQMRRYAQAGEFIRNVGGRFPADREIREILTMARFELDGDRTAFLSAWDALPRDPSDPSGWGVRYQNALIHGDLARAWSLLESRGPNKALNDDAVTNGEVTDPSTLDMARIAWLQGRREEAAALAVQAREDFERRQWLPRNEVWREIRLAETEALSGEGAAAVRRADAAFRSVESKDAATAMLVRPDLGRIYLFAGRNQEALAVMAEIMKAPAVFGPRWMEYDLYWSRLQNEPGFEATLRLARPL